jgi:Arc/MetJ-type ribon-helix-helix transcriptional regulator
MTDLLTAGRSGGIVEKSPARKNRMQIDIAPETECLVCEEIVSGQFHSADEVIRAGVEALREKYVSAATTLEAAPQAPNFFELFTPIRGLLTDEEIDPIFSCAPSPGRPIDLE